MNVNRTDAEIEGKKRQRCPHVIEWECPKCGEDEETSLHNVYLSYPVWGEPYDVPLFCSECDTFEPIKTVSIVPDITVTIK